MLDDEDMANTLLATVDLIWQDKSAVAPAASLNMSTTADLEEEDCSNSIVTIPCSFGCSMKHGRCDRCELFRTASCRPIGICCYGLSKIEISQGLCTGWRRLTRTTGDTRLRLSGRVRFIKVDSVGFRLKTVGIFWSSGDT